MVGLGGSLRVRSYSSAALGAAMAMANDLGFATETLDLRLLGLPMYVPDQALADYPLDQQPVVQHLVAALRGADVMLWSTPTYHGAMSGVFKNALDFMQLLADDERPYLQGCAVGLLTLSDSSPLGGMANCVQELRAWLAPTRVTLDSDDFSADMTLSSAAGRRRLQRLLTELRDFGAIAHS
jgi:FMN reductase